MKPVRLAFSGLVCGVFLSASAKDCNYEFHLFVDHGDGDVEDVYVPYGNAPVIHLAAGETAKLQYAQYGDCFNGRGAVYINGALMSNVDWGLDGLPLTVEGFYVPTTLNAPLLGMYPVINEVGPFFLSFSPPAPPLLLYVKAWLDGPYNASTQLMNDGLRASGLIPLTDGSATTTASVLNVTGANAIVDWVQVTVRRDGLSVMGWRALIQRDGDIVGTDGVSPLSLALPAGNYTVQVRHRNHLGCATASPIAFTASTTVDMRDPTLVMYGTNARKTLGSTCTLWPGSTSSSSEYPKRISYTGANNDRDPILTRVGGVLPTSTVNGYYPEDVNLDGVVKYTGSGNDRDPILANVGSTTPNAVRVEQIP